MRKKAWLFLGCLIVFSAAGMLLRALELRTALDTSTMLMDSVPASWLLLALSAAGLVLMGVLARKGTETELPPSYNRCFCGLGMLVVGGVSLVLTVVGALFCLRDRGSDWSMRIFLGVLSLLAFLGGAAWLALGLDGWRKKKEDSFLSAVLPVVFCGLFLIVFYKEYAQRPALLYTLYPFLGLCAALSALHLIAGFTVGRMRPRLTLFLCGAGAYLCAVSLPGVEENAYRLLLGAIFLELTAHGVSLLLPHDPEPEPETKEEAGEAGAEAPEGEAPKEEAVAAPEAETTVEDEAKPE